MPGERASIPDNWLCISDWQITHRLVFEQRGETERGRGERHVAGSRIPLLLEKYKALWPHVGCQGKPVFILKQKQTLTQLSTPKHIHPHSLEATHRALLFLTLALLTWNSQGPSVYSGNACHVKKTTKKTPLFSTEYPSLSRCRPLFLSCWVKCRWAYLRFGKAKRWMLSLVTSRGTTYHSLAFLKKVSYFPCSIFNGGHYLED